MKGLKDIAMKGNGMTQDNDQRLTPTQRKIRDANNDLPKHVRRSIDRYRQALGFQPLWTPSTERTKR